MNCIEGDDFIRASRFTSQEEKESDIEYLNNYENLMDMVDRVENQGFWITIYTNMVSVGKSGDVKAQWAIHHNGYRTKREMIWLSLIKIIQEN